VTKARDIIEGALRFQLNRLSPGETLDSDVASVCLTALNDLADEFNGGKSFLFQEVFSTGAVTGTSGTLGTTWAGLAPGDQIEGATVAYSAGMDIPLAPLSMAQYANIPLKATASLPQTYTHDGLATVYFYPACTGQNVTLRTRAVVADFADLDTDYSMPKGYKSGFTAMLGERIAPSLLGHIPPEVARAAKAARMRLASQAVDPAIMAGGNRGGNIFSGFR